MAGPPLRIQSYYCGCGKVTFANSRFRDFPTREAGLEEGMRVAEWYGMTSDCNDPNCPSKTSIEARQLNTRHFIEGARAELVELMREVVSIGYRYHRIPLDVRARHASEEIYELAHSQYQTVRTPWRHDPFFSDYLDARSMCDTAIARFRDHTLDGLDHANELTGRASFLALRMRREVSHLGLSVRRLARFGRIAKAGRKVLAKEPRRGYSPSPSPLRRIVAASSRSPSFMRPLEPARRARERERMHQRSIKEAWERRMGLKRDGSGASPSSGARSSSTARSSNRGPSSNSPS